MKYRQLENGQILSVEEVVTNTQTAKIEKHFAFKDKVAIFTEKEIISTEAEVSNITFIWQTFDLSDGIHKNNPTNNTPIIGRINEQELELIPENGQATLEFSSDEPGIYEITTTALETDVVVVEVL